MHNRNVTVKREREKEIKSVDHKMKLMHHTGTIVCTLYNVNFANFETLFGAN